MKAVTKTALSFLTISTAISLHADTLVVEGDLQLGDAGEDVNHSITIFGDSPSNKRGRISMTGNVFEIDGIVSTQVFRLGGTDSVFSGMIFDINANSGSNSTDSYVFRSDNLELFRIDGPTGNIGVGTDSPSAKLEVMGDLKVQGSISALGAMNISSGLITDEWGYSVAHDITIQVPHDAGTYAPGNITLLSGLAPNTQSGAITLATPGDPNISNPGPIYLKSGDGSSYGGSVFIGAGDSLIESGGWKAGQISLDAGSSASGHGGLVSIKAGDTLTSREDRFGGSVVIEAGAAQNHPGSDGGGDIELNVFDGGQILANGDMVVQNLEITDEITFSDGSILTGSSALGGAIAEQSGNVGIGTTTPTAKLDVAGDVKVLGSVSATGAFDIIGRTDGNTGASGISIKSMHDDLGFGGGHIEISTQGGAATSTGDITLLTGDSSDYSGEISLEGGQGGFGGGSVSLTGGDSAEGAPGGISISAGSSFKDWGDGAKGGSVVISAGDAPNQSPPLGGDIELNVVNGGQILANGDVVVSGDLEITGGIQFADGTTLTSATSTGGGTGSSLVDPIDSNNVAISVADGGDVTVAADQTIELAGQTNVTGTMNVTGSLTLAAPSGDIPMFGQ